MSFVHYVAAHSTKSACGRSTTSSTSRFDEVTCPRCKAVIARRREADKDLGNYEIEDDMVGTARRVKKTESKSLSALFVEGPIARLLKEEDDSFSHESGASGDSLDAQVDRYFGDYESSSRKVEGEDMGASVEQMEALDWRDLVKGRLISEAGEDEEGGEEDAAAAAPPTDPAGDDDAGKLGLESLNVESFANDVARLIESYDSLLEIRSTLLRRASSFLRKTYTDEVVDAFESSMRDDHGMEAGSSPQDIESDKFTAPAADRANGSAEPGMGGGGAAA